MRAFVVSAAQLESCPLRSMLVAHWNSDGTCKCGERYEITDEGRAAMREYERAQLPGVKSRFPLLDALRRAERDGLLSPSQHKIRQTERG